MSCFPVQVIRPALLRQGFDLVKSKGLEVTDDVRWEEEASAGEPEGRHFYRTEKYAQVFS